MRVDVKVTFDHYPNKMQAVREDYSGAASFFGHRKKRKELCSLQTHSKICGRTHGAIEEATFHMINSDCSAVEE